jgi:hypothetical protein
MPLSRTIQFVSTPSGLILDEQGPGETTASNFPAHDPAVTYGLGDVVWASGQAWRAPGTIAAGAFYSLQWLPAGSGGGGVGPQGPQGEVGPTGATGPQGPQGATGPQGPAGPQGIQGQVGPDGPAGINKADAFSDVLTYDEGQFVWQGDKLYRAKADLPATAFSLALWDVVGPIIGVTGTAADYAGVLALSPSALHSSEVYVLDSTGAGPASYRRFVSGGTDTWFKAPGQLYLPADTDELNALNPVDDGVVTGDLARLPDGTVYIWAAGWKVFAGVGGGTVGPAGPQGDAGPAGPQGDAGPTGATGPAGADGVDGATGPAGADGATGATGPAGADGATGATGPAGADGATGAIGPAGADGATGATGPAGADGATGAIGPAGADGADATFTVLTQAAYDALTPPLAGVLYLIEVA